jgi:AMP-polyphosphate phosphotransferase
MLEQIDLDVSLSKHEYRERLPELQARLYDMERAVLEARVPVVVLFEGWAGTSKVRTIGVLTRRLDPRGLRVHSITPPRTFEQQYPWLYRFWLKIPSYGQIVIFDRSWYREMLAARTRRGDQQQWLERCEDAVSFERQLIDDGAAVFKFWMHISRREQGRRFKALAADPLTAYQVTAEDRWQHRHYTQYAAAVEDLIARTSTPAAPWQVIPATDKYYARTAVMRSLLETLEARLGYTPAPVADATRDLGLDAAGASFRRRKGPNGVQPPAPVAATREPAASPPAEPEAARGPQILAGVDLSLRLDEKSYSASMKQLQARLHLLGLALYRQQRPAVLVFEGWDAAGKGGAIQRLTAELDPRAYIVHAIAAPSGDDKIRHYLYRFWRRLPPRGQIAIFDRSWYGRVLVERVEGFARPDEWRRAYAEINEFEHQLIRYGTIICKFWLHISPDEQLRRFEERQTVPYKAWKLTDEDWRNREKWPQYEEAADEMLLRTSTPAAPWTVVEAEDKRYGRVKVLHTVAQRLETELGKINL